MVRMTPKTGLNIGPHAYPVVEQSISEQRCLNHVASLSGYARSPRDRRLKRFNTRIKERLGSA